MAKLRPRQRHISIHVLREEDDARPPPPWARGQYFYPRPPRGGRRVGAVTDAILDDFYPRPPRGGRRYRTRAGRPFAKFLSTSSARRTTWTRLPFPARRRFLSTSSARRTTAPLPAGAKTLSHFYPRPPRGGRLEMAKRRIEEAYFYPRPPRGGRRHASTAEDPIWLNFYPRPPRGGRRGRGRILAQLCDFYPRPPRGGRPARRTPRRP